MNRRNQLIFLFILVGSIIAVFQACKQQIPLLYSLETIELDADRAAEAAVKIRQEVAVNIHDDFELDLWAGDSLIADPIAISVAPDGRIFYTSATRQANSEFDIRGHQNWITASISFQTVEDRRAFLRKIFSEQNEEGERTLEDLNEDGTLDWRDLAVEKEQVWFVTDQSGDGIADKAQLYLEDFNEEITDVANGIEFHNGEVYIAVGPDMWRTKDRDNDGIADLRESISHGYAIHIGFSGHGMSGAKVGPDGRIWWGIGDIGANVIDKDGKQWKYPNQGVIVRSEFDGSGFEVYSAGLRNTHEFVFDKYGNLISEDNDGDHSGERERLVHLINGSDCGWRTNWQFGKYTDSRNNDYKVWMDEKLHIPRWEGQAAYILPPIINYVNGPTGMVYNPGTALSPKWYDHFFIAEFRGSPANSPIHAFTLKPKGASFELDTTYKLVEGLLPTGLDFSADGALYFGDWIDGWGTKDAGRIWKLDIPNEVNSAIRQETKSLIQADFSESSIADLGQYLHHQDMRVRQKAQFELVKRGRRGYKAFLAVAQQKEHQLARIHGLWGIAQMARTQKLGYASELESFLTDEDPEIITQAVKMIGDIRYEQSSEALLALLENSSARVRLHATEALGRLAYKPAVQPILDMLLANNDHDTWLRHAGMIALGRIGEEAPLVALKASDSKALRTAAVVALRRMKSPAVAEFLNDPNEFVATEAARAINDDYSIEEALPALAQAIQNRQFTSEPFIRRTINANVRVGQAENIDWLASFAQDTAASAAMRAEALEALSTWGTPSVFDRVDGRYRGVINRDSMGVINILSPILADLLSENLETIQIAAAEAVGRLQIPGMEETLFNLFQTSATANVRIAMLTALKEVESQSLDQALEMAFEDSANEVRSKALSLLPESNIPEAKAISLFENVLQGGTVKEKQATLAALGELQSEAAVKVLTQSMQKLVAGKAEAAIQLDIIEAVANQNNPILVKQLEAYQNAKSSDDPLALYREALVGGNVRQGRRIFYRNQAAQCTRCHAVFEYGGNAGPGLAGVGSRLSAEKLLESMVLPSATYAAGYEVVLLELKNEEVAAGIILDETSSSIKIQAGKDDIQEIDKDQIAKRESVPSAMPSMTDKLSKMEIRDVVAFLMTLKKEEI